MTAAAPTAPPAIAARVAELQRYVNALAADPVWREQWNHRHGSPDGWQSPLRVARQIIDDQAAAIAAGDVATLDSRERFLRSVVSGEEFERGRLPRRRHALTVGGVPYQELAGP